jgi:hypothetical protein
MKVSLWSLQLFENRIGTLQSEIKSKLSITLNSSTQGVEVEVTETSEWKIYSQTSNISI